MIWTEGWYHAEHEQPGCWAWSMSIEEHSDSRWAILWRYRLALARAEVAAFKARLERVGADTTGGGVEFVKFEVLAASMKRVSELEAMYETSHASRMHAEDCVRRLEAENAKLKESVERMVRIYHEQRTELDNTREERNNAQYEAVEAKAENTKLRKCVEAADRILLSPDGGIVDEYEAARAEVDNG